MDTEVQVLQVAIDRAMVICDNAGSEYDLVMFLLLYSWDLKRSEGKGQPN